MIKQIAAGQTAGPGRLSVRQLRGAKLASPGYEVCGDAGDVVGAWWCEARDDVRYVLRTDDGDDLLSIEMAGSVESTKARPVTVLGARRAPLGVIVPKVGAFRPKPLHLLQDPSGAEVGRLRVDRATRLLDGSAEIVRAPVPTGRGLLPVDVRVLTVHRAVRPPLGALLAAAMFAQAVWSGAAARAPGSVAPKEGGLDLSGLGNIG
jgi:hypothetical protein